MNRNFALAILALLILIIVIKLPTPVRGLGIADFRAYWSGSYLLSQGEDFSDPEKIYQVETELTGWTGDNVLYTWNPPWLLALLLPYTQVEFSQAAWLWLLTNITMVVTATFLVWHTLREPGQNKVLALAAPLVAFAFSPTLVALAMGQVNTLVLMGLAGFIYFYNREKQFSAGVLLSLVMVKPHLVYLTLPIIFLKALHERRWRFFAGFAATLLFLTGITWALRPTFLSEYAGHVGQGSLFDWMTPTVGGLIQAATGLTWAKFTGVFLLPILAYLWWTRYRSTPLITLVSVLTILSLITAPFGWSYDFIILLVPILHMLSLAANGAVSRSDVAIIIVAGLAADMVAYYQRVVIENELYFFWIPLVVGILYGWLHNSILQLKKGKHVENVLGGRHDSVPL